MLDEAGVYEERVELRGTVLKLVIYPFISSVVNEPLYIRIPSLELCCLVFTVGKQMLHQFRADTQTPEQAVLDDLWKLS